MSVIDDIKITVQYNISLHEKLRDIVQDECESIANNYDDNTSEKDVHKMEIEQEIERTNKTLISYFERYNKESGAFSSQKDEDIPVLMEGLRQTIHSTITVIESTVEAIKNAKKGVIHQVRDLDINKSAVNAYTKTQLHRVYQ